MAPIFVLATIVRLATFFLVDMRANWNISTRFVRNNIAFRMSSSNSKLQIGLTQQQHQKILFRRASIEEDHHRIHMNTTRLATLFSMQIGQHLM